MFKKCPSQCCISVLGLASVASCQKVVCSVVCSVPHPQCYQLPPPTWRVVVNVAARYSLYTVKSGLINICSTAWQCRATLAWSGHWCQPGRDPGHATLATVTIRADAAHTHTQFTNVDSFSKISSLPQISQYL